VLSRILIIDAVGWLLGEMWRLS